MAWRAAAWTRVSTELFNTIGPDLHDVLSREQWIHATALLITALLPRSARNRGTSDGSAWSRVCAMVATDWRRCTRDGENCSYVRFRSLLQELLESVGVRDGERGAALVSRLADAVTTHHGRRQLLAPEDVAEFSDVTMSPASAEAFTQLCEDVDAPTCSDESVNAMHLLAAMARKGAMPWPWQPFTAPPTETVAESTAKLACDREEPLDVRPMSGVLDAPDVHDPDDHLFAWAADVRSNPAHLLVLGAPCSGKTTLALRLAHALRARYVEPRTLVAAAIAVYRAEYDAAAAKAQIAVAAAARARAAAAAAARQQALSPDGSEDGGEAPPTEGAPAQPAVDTTEESPREPVLEAVPTADDFLDLSPFGILGRDAVQALRERAGASSQPSLSPAGLAIPSELDTTIDLPSSVCVAITTAALVDAYLHDEPYVIDNYMRHDDEVDAVMDALDQIGQDAAVAYDCLVSAMYRLFVDAAAGREAPTESVEPISLSQPHSAASTPGNVSPRDDASVGSARSRSHVRFAEGTKAGDAGRRGSSSSAAGAPGGKGRVTFAGDDSGGGDEEEAPITYDAVEAALAAARLQHKTTLRLWHSQQKRALMQAALARLDRLRQLASAPVRRALLPQQVVTLQLAAVESQHRASLRASGGGALHLVCAPFRAQDPVAIKPPTQAAMPWRLTLQPARAGDGDGEDGIEGGAEAADEAAAEGDATAADAEQLEPAQEEEEVAEPEADEEGDPFLHRRRMRLGRLTDALCAAAVDEPPAATKEPERSAGDDAAVPADAAANETDGTAEDGTAAGDLEALPPVLRRGRVFVHLAHGLPDAVVEAAPAPTTSSGTPSVPSTHAASCADLAAHSADVPTLFSHHAPDAASLRPAELAARAVIDVLANAPPSDVLYTVVRKLLGACTPFACAFVSQLPPSARWLRLPEDLLPPAGIGARDEDADDGKQSERLAFLLQTDVPRERCISLVRTVQSVQDVIVDEPAPAVVLQARQQERRAALEAAITKLRLRLTREAQQEVQAAAAAAENATESKLEDINDDAVDGAGGEAAVDSPDAAQDAAQDEDEHVAEDGDADAEQEEQPAEGAERAGDGDAAVATVHAAVTKPAPAVDQAALEERISKAIEELQLAFPAVPETHLVVKRRVLTHWTLRRFTVVDAGGNPFADSDPAKLAASAAAVAAAMDLEELEEESTPDDSSSALGQLLQRSDSSIQALQERLQAADALLSQRAAQGRAVQARDAAGQSRKWSLFGRFCPVSLLEDGLLVPGRLLFAAEFRGFLFSFADVWKLHSFMTCPRRYLHYPARSGHQQRIAVVTSSSDTEFGAAVANAMRAAARARKMPVVDVAALLQRKVDFAAADADGICSPNSLSAAVHAALSSGAPPPASLIARLIQSELARLAVPSHRSAASPAVWDAAPDPEIGVENAAAANARNRDAVEVEACVSQALAAVAKKKLSQKKLDDLAATERARVLALHAKRDARTKALAALVTAHDSDDEADVEGDETPGMSPRDGAPSGGTALHTTFHSSARAFDTLPRKEARRTALVTVSEDAAVNLEAFTNRMRLHHVLEVPPTLRFRSTLCTLGAVDDAIDTGSPRDESPRLGSVAHVATAAVKDSVLRAVRSITGTDLASGFTYGDGWTLRTGAPGQGAPLSQWSSVLHLRDAAPARHLVDDAVGSLAKQLHYAAAAHAREDIAGGKSARVYHLHSAPSMHQDELTRARGVSAGMDVTEAAAPWVLGLLGQDATMSGSKLLGTSSVARSSDVATSAHQHDVMPASYMLLGVPTSMAVWKLLARKGVIPDSLLCVEPRTSDGNAFQWDATMAEEDGVVGPVLDELSAQMAVIGVASGTQPSSLLMSDSTNQRTAFSNRRVPLAPSASALAAKVDSIAKLLKRYGTQTRRVVADATAIVHELASVAGVREAVTPAPDQATGSTDGSALPEWTLLSGAKPNLPVATNMHELEAATAIVVDALALTADDTWGEDLMPTPPEDEEPVYGASSKYCPVVMKDAGIYMPGKAEPSCTVRIRGATYTCSSPEAARALRLNPQRYLPRRDGTCFSHFLERPRHCVLVAGPGSARLGEVLREVASALSAHVVDVAQVLSAAEKRWREALPAPALPLPESSGEDADGDVAEAEAAEALDEEPPVFPPERGIAAVAAEVRNPSVASMPILLLVEAARGVDAEFLSQLSERRAVPSVVLPCDWTDDEASAWRRSAAKADGAAPVDEDAIAEAITQAVAEDRAAVEGIIANAQASGIPVLPAVPWFGVHNVTRLHQRLLHVLQPYCTHSEYEASRALELHSGDIAELEHAWSRTPAASCDVLSPAILVDASYAVQRLQHGELALGRSAPFCPVAWRDEGKAVRSLPMLLSHALSNAAPAFVEDEEEAAVDDDKADDSSSAAPGAAAPHIWPILVGSVVYFVSSPAAVRRFLSDPFRYISWTLPISSDPALIAVCDGSEQPRSIAAPRIASSLSMLDLSPEVSLMLAQSCFPESAVVRTLQSRLAAGGAVDAPLLRACAMLCTCLAAVLEHGAVVHQPMSTVNDEAAWRGAGTRFRHFVLVANADIQYSPRAGPLRTQDAPSVEATCVTADKLEAARELEEGDLADPPVQPAFTIDQAVSVVAHGPSASTAVYGAEFAALHAHLRERGERVVVHDAGTSTTTSLRNAHALAVHVTAVADQRGSSMYQRRWGRAYRWYDFDAPVIASPVCPTMWSGKRRIMPALDAAAMRESIVVFRECAFVCASPRDAAELLRHPTRYLARWAPPASSQRVERVHFLTTGASAPAQLQLFSAGACIVCASRSREALAPSLIQTAAAAKLGSPVIAFSHNDVVYRCCSEAHAMEFESRPSYYFGTPASAKPPPAYVRPGGAFTQVMLSALHEKAVAAGDFSGYLETSVLPAVDMALRSLDGVRSRLISGRGVPQLQPAILRYLSMHLRAYNPHTKLHTRARSRKSLSVFMEEREKQVGEVVSARSPRKLAPVTHAQTHTPRDAGVTSPKAAASLVRANSAAAAATTPTSRALRNAGVRFGAN